MIWRSFSDKKWLTICICWYSNHPILENFEPYRNMNLQAKSRYFSGFQEPKARHLMMPGGWLRIKSFIRVPCICLNISWFLRKYSRDFYKTKILDLLARCLEKVPKTCSQMVPWWWFTIAKSEQSPSTDPRNSWLNVLAKFSFCMKSLYWHRRGVSAPLSTIRGKTVDMLLPKRSAYSLQDSGDKKHAPNLYIHLLTQEPKWISHMLWT